VKHRFYWEAYIAQIFKTFTAYFRNLKFTPIFTKVCHLTPPWLSLIQSTNSRHISLQSILITLAHVPHKFSKYPHQNVLHVSTSHRAKYSANLILLAMFILITFHYKSRGYSLRSFLQALSLPPLCSNIQHFHIEHPHLIFVLHTHTKYAKIYILYFSFK